MFSSPNEKKLLTKQAQENVDSCCQRWFYSGKLLGDKILIEDAHIQQGIFFLKKKIRIPT